MPEPLSVGPVHLRRPSEAFEDPDQPGAGIELPTTDSVASRRGKGVMQVVPRLPERHETERGHVPAPVSGSKRRGAADPIALRTQASTIGAGDTATSPIRMFRFSA